MANVAPARDLGPSHAAVAVPALRDLLATRPVTLAQLAGATVAAVLPAVVLVTTRARLAPGRHG